VKGYVAIAAAWESRSSSRDPGVVGWGSRGWSRGVGVAGLESRGDSPEGQSVTEKKKPLDSLTIEHKVKVVPFEACSLLI